ncbi:hypothetical protein [Micromonospora zamorensis]|nr:hypothetical protein [Micromonospora zamorensis]SCG38178.1 hypothetical protein GA0070619_0613 [Micromonospora zamorensis]
MSDTEAWREDLLTHGEIQVDPIRQHRRGMRLVGIGIVMMALSLLWAAM